jgi:hypothetical protein
MVEISKIDISRRLSSFLLACDSPQIDLIPTPVPLVSATSIQRSEDIYIMSSITLRCNQTQFHTTRWTLSYCSFSSSCTPLSNQDMPPSVQTSFAEVFIPARTLAYGIYELRLRVTVNTSTNVSASQATYVQIAPSNIVVQLLPFGTSMVTIGVQQDLQLNPGAYSLDQDTTLPFNASVSIFSLFT